MRISDWSSDVCSSDLIAASEAGWSRDIWREMAELGLLAAAIPAEAGGFAEGIEEALVVMEEFGRRLVVEPFSETAIAIGRASCRERVCQYGLISGVAGSLTKKQRE